MKKLSAVVLTAAFVLPVVATSAAAQDEKITIDGLIWLDRNESTTKDSFESVLGNWRGVQVKKLDTDEVVGEFPTDAEGRYQAELPAGKYVVNVLTKGEYSSTNGSTRLVGVSGTFDFGVRGGSIVGRSFLDKNLDGVRQADEELLSPGTLNGKQIPVSREDGQFSVEDLPYGDYRFVAADYTSRGLALRQPLGTKPVDWVTGVLEFKLGELQGAGPLDVMYFVPKAEVAIDDVTVTPAKDAYVAGDQVDLQVKIANKGDVPGKLSFVVSGAESKVVGHSDNVRTNTAVNDLETQRVVLPGETVTVDVRIELPKAEPIDDLLVVARPRVGGFLDTNRDNNSVRKHLKVVEQGTTTPTTSPSETTTAPTTTTTTPQVVTNVAKKDGLASTGASVLGFLGLGALLLAAGTSAFFIARRRRS